MLTSTTIGLGLISMLGDSTTFFMLASILRFLQGTGDVLLQITCYSVITSMFKDDISKYIVYIEIAAGIGLGLGPSIGSLVY
jgi:MFS family permease